jgi:hypothetical protein
MVFCGKSGEKPATVYGWNRGVDAARRRLISLRAFYLTKLFTLIIVPNDNDCRKEFPNYTVVFSIVITFVSSTN